MEDLQLDAGDVDRRIVTAHQRIMAGHDMFVVLRQFAQPAESSRGKPCIDRDGEGFPVCRLA